MMKKIVSTTFIAFALTACASSKPSCAVGQGLGCQSVMDVNFAINQGYGNETLSSAPKAQKLKLAAPDTFDEIPQRSEEQWVKVWVPPHVDEHDNYHPEHTYYTVIQSSTWKGSAGE